MRHVGKCPLKICLYFKVAFIDNHQRLNGGRTVLGPAKGAAPLRKVSIDILDKAQTENSLAFVRSRHDVSSFNHFNT